MTNKLIVALDVDSYEKAHKLIDFLTPHVDIFKIGSELFIAYGPDIIEHIHRKEKKVFLDLKLFDIPNTVRKAALAAARRKVYMITLHITGGRDMLKEATKAIAGEKDKPLLIGVTVLTSKEGDNVSGEVLKMARVAEKTGLDGIVCSARETKKIKDIFGEKLIVVNPGIRPTWFQKNLSSETKQQGGLPKKDDQKRVATPKEAMRDGANFIVVGRPIIEANDPARAAKKILDELK